MKVTLYQMRADEDNARLLFMELRYVQNASGGRVPAERYEAVFSGELDIKSPEDVFYIFNMEHPEGYRGRSMSVSDVVEIHDTDMGSSFYYCEPVGFRQIAFDKDKVSGSGNAQDRLQRDAAERMQNGKTDPEL